MTARERRRERYREWLAAQHAQYGFDDEIAGLAIRVSKGIPNDVPPLELWHQVLPTLRVLELVRERFGPTTVLSAYRAPQYNSAIGGEERSWHMQNRALDFRATTGSPGDWATFLRGLRDAGRFTGGVGVYPSQGFVHVDTRGTVADWIG
jgi:N-acetylmuramoyl-L-alanine amidase